jgi:hypothetical protein
VAFPKSARVGTIPPIPTSPRISDYTSTCRNGANLASPTLSAWLHHPVKSFREFYYRRESTDTPGNTAHVAIFSSPETVAAYVERLDTTTLAFAIDAAHIIGIVPPHQGSEYIILDNACGTGAAVEWIINEFGKQGVHLDITATDHSAVMMNEVAKRRERLNWGDNVKSILMDAQVHLSINYGLISGAQISSKYIYSCFHDIWNHVDSGLRQCAKKYLSCVAEEWTSCDNIVESSRALGLSRQCSENRSTKSQIPSTKIL